MSNRIESSTHEYQINSLYLTVFNACKHPSLHRSRRVFPRLIALAEKAWTKEANMDYNDFIRRLVHEFGYLDSIGIYYYDFRDPERHPEPMR